MRLIKRVCRFARSDDTGSSLVPVIFAMLLGVIVVSIVATLTIFGTKFTVNQNSLVQANAAAEAGRDSALASLAESGCTAVTSGSVDLPNASTSAGVSASANSEKYSWIIYSSTASTASAAVSAKTQGCPTSSSTFVVINSTGTAADGTVRTIDSVYAWKKASTTSSGSSVTGVITAASSGLTLNNGQTITGANITVASGDFSCNSSGEILSGNVYVLSGSVYLTNSCQVAGNVYASGKVSLDSNAKIGGNVYAGGDVSLANSTVTIGGSVQTKGTLQISGGGTIGGSVTSSSTSSSRIYNAIIGSSSSSVSVTIAGYFSTFQSSKVYGNVAAASSTQSQNFYGTTISGNLTLAKAPSGSNGGLTVGGTTTYAATAAPTVSTPTELTTTFNWIDFGFDYTSSTFASSAWGTAGYVLSVPPTCGWSDWNGGTLINQIKSATSPTVYDLRKCGFDNASGASISIHANVVLILPTSASLQSVKVSSADGNAHTFSVIVPDNTTESANSPTCSSGSTKMDSFTMAANISGLIYSPCATSIGAATIHGQVYAKLVSTYGNATISYVQMTIPGFGTSSSSGSSTSTSSAGSIDATLLAQQQVN